jgi:acetamidase/formamidase
VDSASVKAEREEKHMALDATLDTVGHDYVVVDRYTDIVGPSNEMLGPVKDGGRIEFLTVPGCWGPMITPSIRSGHEVTLPVRVEGAKVGDAVALHVDVLRQVSRATTSGTHTGWDGRYISDPFVAAICPTCRDAGRHFLYPDTYLDGLGQSAVRCKTCRSEVIPFRMVEGYTMVFDDAKEIGVTISPERAQEIGGDARAWVGLTEHSRQHPIVALAQADLVGVMTRCRISIGNLGSIPAIDLPSSHNCGDFGAFLVGAEHEFAVTEEQLEQRTDVHMDIDSVREGSIVIVPVKVDGAGIYAGDAHAMIGDGEVAVHTTDVGATLVVRVEVIKGLALSAIPGPPVHRCRAGPGPGAGSREPDAAGGSSSAAPGARLGAIRQRGGRQRRGTGGEASGHDAGRSEEPRHHRGRDRDWPAARLCPGQYPGPTRAIRTARYRSPGGGSVRSSGRIADAHHCHAEGLTCRAAPWRSGHA